MNDRARHMPMSRVVSSAQEHLEQRARSSLPLTPSRSLGDSRLPRTLEVRGRRSDRLLTEEDGRQIAENVVGFFRVLIEWKAAKVQRDRSRSI